MYIEQGCSGAMKHRDVREWPYRTLRFFIGFAYMDVGKGREPNAEALPCFIASHYPCKDF